MKRIKKKETGGKKERDEQKKGRPIDRRQKLTLARLWPQKKLKREVRGGGQKEQENTLESILGNTTTERECCTSRHFITPAQMSAYQCGARFATAWGNTACYIHAF